MDVQARQVREQIWIGLAHRQPQRLLEVSDRFFRVLVGLRAGTTPARLGVRLRERGVDGSQDPMRLGVTRRDLQRLLGSGHRLADAVLAHVEAGKLGWHLGSRRVEGHRPLVCADRSLDIIVALEIAGRA